MLPRSQHGRRPAQGRRVCRRASIETSLVRDARSAAMTRAADMRGVARRAASGEWLRRCDAAGASCVIVERSARRMARHGSVSYSCEVPRAVSRCRAEIWQRLVVEPALGSLHRTDSPREVGPTAIRMGVGKSNCPGSEMIRPIDSFDRCVTERMASGRRRARPRTQRRGSGGAMRGAVNRDGSSARHRARRRDASIFPRCWRSPTCCR